MNKTVMALIIAAISFPVLSKSSLTGDFVKDVQSAIDSNGESSSSIDIVCPAQSASGKLLVTYASYDYGKSKGVFVFKNTDSIPAAMTSITPVFPGGNLDSPVIDGWEFGFKMPNGQLFVTVLKNGKVKAGVNKNGTSGVTEINCKVARPD